MKPLFAKRLRGLGALLLGSFALTAAASDDALREYREMFGDDNPAALWEARGEQLWQTARGPQHASLAACDLGLGPGVVKGAYAQLPRWFADTARVEDLESRLLTCMTELQGFPRDALLTTRFGDGERKSDLEALAAYVVGASRGAEIRLPLQHPAEQAAWALGQAAFYYRAGPHDFSCATCHAQADKRIRLQTLPQLTTAEGAREAYTHWPAYRISQGELRTFEWRLQDCYRQQRFPQLKFASEVAVGLSLFLAKTAEGGAMAAPAIRR